MIKKRKEQVNQKVTVTPLEHKKELEGTILR